MPIGGLSPTSYFLKAGFVPSCAAAGSSRRRCLTATERMVDRNSADIDRGRRRDGLRRDRKSRAIARVCNKQILVSRLVSALVIDVGNAVLDTRCENAEHEWPRAP